MLINKSANKSSDSFTYSVVHKYPDELVDNGVNLEVVLTSIVPTSTGGAVTSLFSTLNKVLSISFFFFYFYIL